MGWKVHVTLFPSRKWRLPCLNDTSSSAEVSGLCLEKHNHNHKMEHNQNQHNCLKIKISVISELVSSAVNHVVMCWHAARGTSFIQRGLQERLLSERWEAVPLHIRKYPLQQDPQSLLEGSAAQDVHGRTECHPDVGLLHVSVCFTLTLDCCCSQRMLFALFCVSAGGNVNMNQGREF